MHLLCISAALKVLPGSFVLEAAWLATPSFLDSHAPKRTAAEESLSICGLTEADVCIVLLHACLCTDVQECATNNGGCAVAPIGICTERVALPPICSCAPGYMMNADNSCTGKKALVLLVCNAMHCLHEQHTHNVGRVAGKPCPASSTHAMFDASHLSKVQQCCGRTDPGIWVTLVTTLCGILHLRHCLDQSQCQTGPPTLLQRQQFRDPAILTLFRALLGRVQSTQG